MPTDFHLSDAAADMLDAAVAALTATESGDRDDLLPARQLIAPGAEWAHDCEMLVVHVANLAANPDLQAPTAPGRPTCPVVPEAVIVATVLYECVPTSDQSGDPPAPDLITAAADRVLDGGMTLWRGIARARREGTLFPSLEASCADVQFSEGGATPIGPEAGLAGWEIGVVVTLA